jgi:hypothetical protein
VLLHKFRVFIAGRKMGVGFWQLLRHDLSKLSRVEFAPARNKFICNKHSDDYLLAAHNHFRKSFHHWECWIFQRTLEPFPMSEKYVREMVADWMASSYEYTGSWNIKKWVSENRPAMKLHPETEKILDEVLKEGSLTRKG